MPTMIPTAADGHQHRLAAAINLIESCLEMGEKLDPETAIDVLAAAEVELERQAEKAFKGLTNPPQATMEDFRDAHAVIAATRILWDLVGCMELRKAPSRNLRLVRKARDILYQDVLTPLLLSLPKGEKSLPLKNATEWFYTLWSPEHLGLFHLVMESVLAGKPPKKEIKEAARYLQRQFIGTVALDQERHQQQAAAAE